MPAPSACSGLKELVECPGVMSTVTCWAKTDAANTSSPMPVFNRFNRPAECAPNDLRIVSFMPRKLQRQEVRYFNPARQVFCQNGGTCQLGLSALIRSQGCAACPAGATPPGTVRTGRGGAAPPDAAGATICCCVPPPRSLAEQTKSSPA